MRLIDADELIKQIGKWMPEDPCGREQTVEEIVAADIAASVCMEIEEMPTAFDKEKAIEELQKCADDSYDTWSAIDSEQDFGEAMAYKNAIKIIEKGGIE